MDRQTRCQECATIDSSISCGRQKRQRYYNSLLDDDLGHVIFSDLVVNLDLEYFTSHHIDFRRLIYMASRFILYSECISVYKISNT